MVKQNPFSEGYDSGQDQELIQAALKGERVALDRLVQRHHNFIYNVALRMLGRVEDAKDLTQDVVIKVITNLAKYDPQRGQFRTWLYRIAFNHILNYKKSQPEQVILGFSQFFSFVESVEDDTSVSMEEEARNPQSVETKMRCMNGMLMCVRREDRLLYILGDLFQIDHNLGAELFNISKANFRKKLSRVRADLRQWMDNKCGLVNKNNPCRCARKTKGFIDRGIVDPDKLVWDKEFSSYIKKYTATHLHDALRSSDRIYSQLYQEQPFKEDANAGAIVEEILRDDNLKDILEL